MPPIFGCTSADAVVSPGATYSRGEPGRGGSSETKSGTSGGHGSSGGKSAAAVLPLLPGLPDARTARLAVQRAVPSTVAEALVIRAALARRHVGMRKAGRAAVVVR
jgi:hypothetical protein